ncbi:MAG: restriction endonuclease [Acidibacillus sp.]|nr:restriction endonuclease [Acidibacillus sp.]
MSNKKVFSFIELPTADLKIDAIYRWGDARDLRAEPISKLLPGCGNSKGIRVSGRYPNYKFAVLYSDFSDVNWPDLINYETGEFEYFGDNKTPGYDLHSTNGNKFLRYIFDALHTNNRSHVCPIFIFTQGESKREIIFRGLAVPGTAQTSQFNDLVAVWKTTNNARFQNYRSIFTILSVSTVSRDWIIDIQNGNPLSINCPYEWAEWIKKELYNPLQSPRTIEYRTEFEQKPSSQLNLTIVQTIIDYFAEDSYMFEKCAVEIANIMLNGAIIEYKNTPKSRDGGRDAYGKMRIGLTGNSILIDFSLEAKCYSLENGVGVKETSRLISRLKNRQFGILVTTSYVKKQAYSEIKEDGHPVIIVCAEDIAIILKSHGYSSKELVEQWLNINFTHN